VTLRWVGWLLVLLLGAAWAPPAAAASSLAGITTDACHLSAVDVVPARRARGDSDVLQLRTELPAEGGTSDRSVQRVRSKALFTDASGDSSKPEPLRGIFGDNWRMIMLVHCVFFMLLVALPIVIHDDRRRRRLLEKVKERDRCLSDLMDLLPGGVCIFVPDRNGRLQADFLNLGFYRMLGYAGAGQEALAWRDMTDWAHPKDRPGMLAELERCQRDNDEYCNTFRLRKEDGSYFWVTLRGTPVKMTDGRLVYYGIFTNVNAIKEMYKRLEESEMSMRAAMNQFGMNYWEYDPEHHLAHCNRNSQQLLGVPEWMENYPASWFQMGITHPEDAPVLERAMREIDAGAAEAVCEIRERTVEGSYRWERVCLVSLYDWGGNRTKVLSTGIDITPQKEAERFYEQRLTQLRSALPDARTFFRLDLTQNLCLESYSRSVDLSEMAGRFTADELFEEMASHSVTEREKQVCRQLFNRWHLMEVFENGREAGTAERRFWEGGKVCWISIRTRLDRNPANGHVEALIYSLDIDERKWIQQIAGAVLCSQYRLFVRIDLSHNTARLYNAHTGRFLKEHGCPPETIERYICQHCSDADREEFLKKVSLSEVERQLQNSNEYVVYSNLKLNGRQMRAKCVFFWMDREQRTVCFALADITDAAVKEQSRTEELSRALSAAEEASRTKSEFLSRMSHEIRTPLNCILGMAQIGKTETTDGTVQEDFDKIITSGEYLMGLINDVLDMSRIENGRILLHPENTDTGELLNSVLTIVGPQIKKRNIRFEVKSSGVASRYVVIDRMRVLQIYINLLNNAIKFSAPGTTIEFCVHYEPAGENLVGTTVVIRDQGCGMSEEFLKRIFSPFEQEHNQYSDSQPGTGLGLAIVKNLLDQMGGGIQVESRLGEGTAFTITLTVPKGCEPEKAAPPEPPNLPVKLSGSRVLLAEDHPTNAEIVRKLLEKEGVLLEHAPDGQAALKLYLSRPDGYFDAMLMDIRMPVMNGIEAAEAIRASGRQDAKKLPIIAMSAGEFETDCLNTSSAGINGYLIKPFYPPDLYDILCRRIGEYRK